MLQTAEKVGSKPQAQFNIARVPPNGFFERLGCLFFSALQSKQRMQLSKRPPVIGKVVGHGAKLELRLVRFSGPNKRSRIVEANGPDLGADLGSAAQCFERARHIVRSAASVAEVVPGLPIVRGRCDDQLIGSDGILKPLERLGKKAPQTFNAHCRIALRELFRNHFEGSRKFLASSKRRGKIQCDYRIGRPRRVCLLQMLDTEIDLTVPDAERAQQRI